MVERLLASKPRIVGFGVYIWNVEETARVVAMLKRVAPEVVVVLGGPEVSHETNGQEIVRLSKEHAELKPVVDAVQGLARARAEMADLEAMTADPEMAAMAEEELRALNDKLPELEREVALLLAPRDADENASAVLEVRAGRCS